MFTNIKEITMPQKLLVLAAALIVLAGCTPKYYSEVKDADLIEVSYDAVDTLQCKLKRSVPKNSLVIVSTLLNVDNLKQTSSFGRIISDQIASALHNSGYQVIGMELPIDLFVMQPDGTLHLPDEVKQMLKYYNATTLVGGVYAPGKKNTYVSLRMVNLETRNIISSTDLSIPMGPDAKALLENREVGSNNGTAGKLPETPAPEKAAAGAGAELPLDDDELPEIK